MTILITGGTGFIGAEIVRRLVDAGEERPVHVAHRSGNFQRISDLIDRVALHQVDFADRDAIESLVAEVRPDVVYHFAAVLTGPGEADPPLAVETNAIGTYALLEAARRADVRQVIFASSIGSYGLDVTDDVIDDTTIQRPLTVYGVTKLFGEQLGAFYRRSFGLDFRGIRYPSIIGPGVKTPSVVQYTSWLIEKAIRGEPFTAVTRPDLAVPVLYYKDAGKAAIDLSNAPPESIRTVNYVVDGARPTPTAADLADAMRARIPGAAIEFSPDPDLQAMLDEVIKPLDDARARDEWGWAPAFDLEAMVDDFVTELRDHPERYA